MNISARQPSRELLLRVKNDGSSQQLLKEYDAELVERFDAPKLEGDILHIRLNGDTSEQAALKKLRQDARVMRAAPNTRVQKMEGLPGDLNSELWGLHNTGQDKGTPDADIDAPEAWRITTGKREGGPVIAVIDTGVQLDHPDLDANIWTNPGEIPGNGIDDDGNGVIDDVHGFDATLNKAYISTKHSHGTHCAGTIAAEANNDEGIVGVNHHAQIMPIKIFPDDGDSATAATIIRAALYADKMGARITSNSWTGGGYNPVVRDVFGSSEAFHVFAAGNDATNNDEVPSYPASFNLDNSVVVAASDRNDQLGYFSNYGKKSVNIAAPGVAIKSTVLDSKYATYNGTSMATPHVAGVAGLIASEFPDISNQQLKDRLLFGTDAKPQFADRVSSGGRLNAANSVSRDALPPAAPSDFKAGGGAATVRMRWTPTGDDGFCGKPSGYEVKFSDTPITAENWDEIPLLESGRTNPVDGPETKMYDVVPSATARTMYAGIKLVDKVGNRSELKSSEVKLSPGTVRYEGGDWTKTGEWDGLSTKSTGSLTSPPIDMSGLGDVAIHVESDFNLEPHYDRVVVEARSVGAEAWREAIRMDGGQAKGKVYRLPVHSLDGGEMELRIRTEITGPAGEGEFTLKRVAVSGYGVGTQEPLA